MLKKDLDKIIEQLDAEDWRYLNDAWASQFFTHDNYVESVYDAEMAEKDATIEKSVKNLYAQHFDIRDISRASKLSIEEIN